MEFNFNKYYQLLDKIDPIKMNGRVTKLVGLFVESLGPNVCLGEVCMIKPRNGSLPAIAAEVVGFKENKVQLMPLAETTGIAPGSEVVATGSPLKIAVDRRLLGRIVDGLGQPLDNHPPINNPEGFYSTLCQPPNPLTRPRITRPLITGVRCIDGLITLGKGQRVGIFAGSGVGKSTLLGMIARNTRADINVIALIGERGREVKEFIERDLGEEGLKRSVVVVATSDQSSLVRLKGAMVATTIAEYFRDLGMDVVLMMDSVTRFARAQREIGLAVEARHRKLAALNHYPAISVLDSISRLMTDVVDKHHQKFANIFKSNLAVYSEAQELINIGAYVDGSNPQIDKAKALYPDMCDYMKQTVQDRFSFEDAVDDLQEILKDYK